MFDQRRETLKAHWMKRSKTVQKRPRNMNQKINHSKTLYLEFIFYFQIFCQKISKPTKYIKKDHSFYNTIPPKKPHSFHEPQLTQQCKKHTPTTQLKNLPILQVFHQPCFCLESEKIFALLDFQTHIISNCILAALAIKCLHHCKNYLATLLKNGIPFNFWQCRQRLFFNLLIILCFTLLNQLVIESFCLDEDIFEIKLVLL